jgi:hypothetical protein
MSGSVQNPTTLTALHYVVLAWLARHQPADVDDPAQGLGLPTPLTRALVAELQLAELVAPVANS